VIKLARPKVDSRLQNIEDGIKEIKNKLCEIHPCNSKSDEPMEESEE